jgi:dephospho-CoA kinase
MRIGLTGGIGSGKSTAAARFTELGATVIDADQLARQVLAPGTPGLAAVLDRFGAELADADGVLDRARLAGLVFADPAALADLNAIVHPLVAIRTAELTEAAGPDAVVVYDVPLLVENGLAGGFQAVVVVEAPLPARLARLAERGMAEAEARSRIAAQASDAQRRALATAVLDNSGSVAELRAQVDDLLATLTGHGGEQPGLVTPNGIG